MKSRLLSLYTAVGLAVAGLAAAQPPSDTPPPPPQPQQGVDVQTRGPVHEAYAELSEQRPGPSPVVARQPPDPIEEMPPDQKPEGDSVLWIPGYWAWDADQNNFLWVSGFWRIPPPGRQWVPGTWQQVAEGWQWTPGYWAPVDQEEQQYVPTPPPSLDEGPSTPAPQENTTYVPGCWIYRQTRFLWRPGFWAPFHPGWVWIPAHYAWTPAGCLFVEGYWDHPLDARGLLFAPVQIDATLLTQGGWTYVPQYVVQPDFLLSALFVRPANCHYYFGDYFEARYQRSGFIPWIDYRVGRASYDPNFNYFRHQFARNASWERGLRELYAGRLQGTIARPPRTLVQQNQVIQNLTVNKTINTTINRNIGITNLQNVSVVAPLTRVNHVRVTGLAALANTGGPGGRNPGFSPHELRLQEVPRAQRVQEQKTAVQFHVAAQQRRDVQAKLVAEGTAPVRVTDAPRTARIPVPRTPSATSVSAPAPRPNPTQPGPHAPPPAPRVPPHEDRPLPPQHEPPRPAAPPRPTSGSPGRPPAPAPRPEPPRPAPAPRQPPPPPPHQANPPAPAPKPPAPAPKPPPPPHQEAPKPAPAPAPKPPAPAPKPPPPPHHEAPKPPPPHQEAPKPPAPPHQAPHPAAPSHPDPHHRG